MLNIVTIGSSWITEQFIDAIQNNKAYHLYGVYSRTQARAKQFAEKHQASTYFYNLDDLMSDANVDIIYIASPNSVHYEQAMKAIKHKKHLIIEKPLATTLEESQQIFAAAKEHEVFVFEAIRNIHYQNYQALKQMIQSKIKHVKGQFFGANFVTGQYSSKYDEYVQAMKAGEVGPNIFNPEFKTGTLMDIGIYPLYVALDLFGRPDSVERKYITGPNGTDLYNHLFLNYDNFYVTIFISKAVHSPQDNEFYFDDQVVQVPEINNMNKIIVKSKKAELIEEINYPYRNPLDDEIKVFAEIINHQTPENLARYQELSTLSSLVVETINRLQAI